MEIAAANKGAVYVVKREDRGGAGRTFRKSCFLAKVPKVLLV